MLGRDRIRQLTSCGHRHRQPFETKISPHAIRIEKGSINGFLKVSRLGEIPVKITIFTHTFSYTPLSDTCKSLMANRDRSVQSSHNPLVLDSNPSGPSLSPKTDSRPIRQVRVPARSATSGEKYARK